MNSVENSTKELLRLLSTAENIDAFVGQHAGAFVETTFNACLVQLLHAKGLPVREVILRSNMQESYCYQLMKGTRKPSRDKILQLGLGLKLTLQEMNQLLRAGGKNELYCRDKRDALLIFAINRELNVLAADEMLYDRNLKLLSE